MNPLNIFTAIAIIALIILSIAYDVNLYISYIILGMIVVLSLGFTFMGWKKKSEQRGDSWDGVITWIKSFVGWK